MLTEHTIQTFLERVRTSELQLSTYKPSSQLYHLEARYALFYLRALLSSRHQDVDAALLAFFTGRSKIMSNRDIHYLHDFMNPANSACISIAHELGRLKSSPYLAILLPSLCDVPKESYLTSSYTDEVLLSDIVLSDSNTRIIHIPDVLDFSQEDGRLKHNSLFLGKTRVLTASEQERCLSRHKTVRDAFDALQARVRFKLYGDTVGAAINRLIQNLRNGGVKKKGHKADLDSGDAANEGILEFHEYLQTLAPAIRQQLMSASKFDRFGQATPEVLSIGMLWDRLARPEEKDYTKKTYEQTIYCVELIASRLEEVLNENPNLYDLMSYEGEALMSVAKINADVIETRDAMSIALPSIESHACYGQAKDEELCIELTGIILSARDFYLNKDDIVYFAKQYMAFINRGGSDSAIGHLLRHVRQSHGSDLIGEAITELSVEERAAFIRLTGYGLTPFWHSPSPLPEVSRETHRSKRPADQAFEQGRELKRT